MARPSHRLEWKLHDATTLVTNPWCCYAAGVYELAEQNAAPVDILVATPGRLMAHLKGTPGASLKHLRYLVRPHSPAYFIQQ